MDPNNRFQTVIVLNSWKEIANYVGRGVRTVQRWEADLGMPVRRPRAKSRSAVLAMSDEIDAWLRSAPAGELKPQPANGMSALEEFWRSVAEPGSLRGRCQQLRAENEQPLSALIVTLQAMASSVKANRQSRAELSDYLSLRNERFDRRSGDCGITDQHSNT